MTEATALAAVGRGATFEVDGVKFDAYIALVDVRRWTCAWCTTSEAAEHCEATSR